VDVVVAVRVARRAAAFLVAEPAVETGCLEGVGAQGYPVAIAAPDLSFGCGEELGSTPQLRWPWSPLAQQMPALTVARSSGLAPEQVMGKLSGGPLPRPAPMAGASSAAHRALT
jgi:hypothetical protein